MLVCNSDLVNKYNGCHRGIIVTVMMQRDFMRAQIRDFRAKEHVPGMLRQFQLLDTGMYTDKELFIIHKCNKVSRNFTRRKNNVASTLIFFFEQQVLSKINVNLVQKNLQVKTIDRCMSKFGIHNI